MKFLFECSFTFFSNRNVVLFYYGEGEKIGIKCYEGNIWIPSSNTLKQEANEYITYRWIRITLHFFRLSTMYVQVTILNVNLINLWATILFDSKSEVKTTFDIYLSWTISCFDFD